MEQEKERSRKKTGIILWAFIGVLVITNGITLWLLLKEKTELVKERIVTKEVLVEKDNVQAELPAPQKDYQTLQGTDAAMQLDIDEKKARIEELIKEAAKHKG